jgi:CheY-like chemotaxis protein
MPGIFCLANRGSPSTPLTTLPMATSILLLEDDVQFCELVKQILEDEGFDVVACQDGETAIQNAQYGRFHLFLSDVRVLGKKDGIAAAAAIKELHPKILVVIMTGYTDAEAPVKALQIQVDEFIYKNAIKKMSDILDPVYRALNKPKQRQEHLQAFAKIFQAPKRLLERISGLIPRENVLAKVSEAREKFYQEFFVALHPERLICGGPSLTIWDLVYPIEVYYEEAGKEPKFLLEEYLKVTQTLENMVLRQAVGQAKKREPWQLPFSSFQKLYNNVLTHKIKDDTVLGAAPYVWYQKSHPEKQQNPIPGELWQTLFE